MLPSESLSEIAIAILMASASQTYHHKFRLWMRWESPPPRASALVLIGITQQIRLFGVQALTNDKDTDLSTRRRSD